MIQISLISRKLLTLIVSLLVIFVLFPLFTVALLWSLVFRTIVVAIARIFRRDLCQVFSGTGVLMALESIWIRPKLNIVVYFVCKGTVSLEQLRLSFEQQVIHKCNDSGNLVYAQLRQYWIQFFGYLFWKWDEKFHLNNHVRCYDYTEKNLALPSPCTEEDLLGVMGELVAKPYKEKRSPWELLLLTNYVPKGRAGEYCVLILRIHHAMADGHSIVKMMRQLCSDIQTTVPRPVSQTTWKQRVKNNIVEPLAVPYRMAEIMLDSSDGANSWHPLGKKLARKYHIFSSDLFPVKTVKEIKDYYGVSYNVALFSITLGAIRRMMEEAKQEVPESMACFVPLPLPNHPGGLVIHVSGAVFKTSLRSQSSEERLRSIAAAVEKSQGSLAPLVCGWILRMSSVLPVWAIKLFYNKMMNSITITSFAGPEKLDIFGTATLHEMIFAVGHPPGTVAAMACLISTSGTQRVLLTVDKEIFRGRPVPTNFHDYVMAELNLLQHPLQP